MADHVGPLRLVASHDVGKTVRLARSSVLSRTVLIVDDSEAFRESARSLLAHQGFDVVGVAANGHEALALAIQLHPDIVLLDIQLPDLDGFAVADGLAAIVPAPDVVLVSGRDGATFGARLTRATVRGFLAKGELTGAALARLLG